MTTYLVTAYLDDPGPETLGPLRRAVRGSARHRRLLRRDLDRPTDLEKDR